MSGTTINTALYVENQGGQMGRIVVSDNVSLDGVFEDPAGDEGFPRGRWVGLIADRPELANSRSTRPWARMPC